MPRPDRLIHEFEGKRITTYCFQGRPCWIAQHIGALLGYSHHGKRFANKITGDWSEDLIPGHDYDLLQGDSLAELRGRLQHGDDAFPARASSMVALYEPGLHLALARTAKPVGRRLRRFVASEVLPQLARTERGSAEHGAESVEPGAEGAEPSAEGAESAERAKSADARVPSVSRTLHLQVLPPLLLNLHAIRERRPLRQALLAEARFRSSSLRQTIYTLRELGRISDETFHVYEVRATEIALSQDLADLRPSSIETWESPEDIAKRLGISHRRVWRAISRLWIRGDLQDMVHSAGRRPSGDGRDSFVFLYPPGDVERVEQELRERDEAQGERA